jgi:hypothetical protein
MSLHFTALSGTWWMKILITADLHYRELAQALACIQIPDPQGFVTRGSPNSRVTRGHLGFVCLKTAIVSKENKNQGINVIWTYLCSPVI